MEGSLRGYIFNIQRYSIHDGPGIRTTVFFKGCPLRCFWCQNPESQLLHPQILLDNDKCSGCGKCIKACPNGANSLNSRNIASLDRIKCTACGKCVEVCFGEARKVAGKLVSVEEVVAEVLKDVKFYNASGGGVTLSGGEPCFQTDFAKAVLKECKEADLHTALDTCGYSTWNKLKGLLNYTDFVLFDIKNMDSLIHYGATGKKNDLILRNAKRTSNYRRTKVRVPLIPGFNDSPAELKGIMEFVRTELNIVDMELLPYNKFGEAKYRYLDRKATEMNRQNETEIGNLNQILEAELAGLK